MRLAVFKDYQSIHIWTGILSGLLLYICFIAGALTMFKGPLNEWALQPSSTLPAIEYEHYDHLIQSVLTTHPQAAKEMTVYLPSAGQQQAPLRWVIEDPESHARTFWLASLDENHQLITQQTSVSAVGDFIDMLHRTAGIPGGDDHDAYGIWIMGLVCFLYFVAIVSGLIIFLPNWLKDLFSLRKRHNNRRFWVDFHNILGISALPFHVVIAVTTIVFAYHDVLYGAMQQWVYQDKPMFNRQAPLEIDRSSHHLASIEQLQQAIQTLEPNFTITELRYAGLGTARARVVVGGELYGEWIRGPEYAFWVSDPYTASSGYTAMLPSVSGAAGKIVNGFFTLHFGGFGGQFIHWLYFAMGLSGALLFFSGNVIWIESRRKKMSQAGNQPRRSVKILARLTTGVTLGTLIGLSLALVTVKLVPHHLVDIQSWQTSAYYIGFLFCVALSLKLSPLASTQVQLPVLTLLLILLSISSAWSFTSGIGLSVHLTVSAISLLLAALSVLAFYRIQQKKSSWTADGVWQQ